MAKNLWGNVKMTSPRNVNWNKEINILFFNMQSFKITRVHLAPLLP